MMNTNEMDYSYENQPYMPLLAETVLQTPKQKGVVNIIHVKHDDWCPVLSGTGLCICRPIVRRANRTERRLAKKGKLS